MVTNEQSDHVFRSGDICGEINDNWNSKTVYVSCLNYTPINGNPKRGRYVRIQRKDSATYEKNRLSFCEVEVMSCPMRRYGYNRPGVTDCALECGYCRDDACRVGDGHCYDGCKEGWWGYSMGGDCKKPCGKCRGGPDCGITTGRCLDGCLDGWWGYVSRNDGDCMQQCSTTCVDNVCHRGNGDCIRGCVTGYWGSMCDKQCHCLHGTACDRPSGYCPEGCADGYWGTTSNCKPCTCNPGVQCDSSTGTCKDGAVNIQTDPPATPIPPTTPSVSYPTSTTTTTTTTTIHGPDAHDAQHVKEDSDGDDMGMISGFTVALLILVFIILIGAFFFIR